MSYAGERDLTVDPLCSVDGLVSPDELELVNRVRSFVRASFAPDAGAFFVAGDWPRELLVELARLGIYDLHLDPDASAVAFGLAFAELGAGDLIFARLVAAHAGDSLMAIAARGSSEVRAEWSEALCSGESIGCQVDSAIWASGDGVRFEARVGGDGWILSGTARQVLLAPRADVMVVCGLGPDGPLECVVARTAPGVSVHSSRHLPPPMGGLLGDVTYDDVAVAREAQLTAAADVATDRPGPQSGWTAYAAICAIAGASRASLEELSEMTPTAEGLRLASEVLGAVALALHLGRRWDAGCLLPRQLELGAMATTRAADKVASVVRSAAKGGVDGRSVALRYLVGRQYLNFETEFDRADPGLAEGLAGDA